MSPSKMLFPAALALACTLGAGVAEARTDVQWSINIGLPVYGAPVYAPAPVYYAPAPVYYAPAPVYYAPAPQVVYPEPVVLYRRPVPAYGYSRYAHPTRWDVDGDGIPNRYDRNYSPRWDRNGNGVPDRREVHYSTRGNDRYDDRYQGQDRGRRDRDPYRDPR